VNVSVPKSACLLNGGNMIFDRKRAVAAALGLVLAGYAASAAAQVDQPHMQKALADLQNARAELDAAARDKGGHRGRAVQYVDQAIGEVHAGIAAGDEYRARHPH
jgi:hypothetical protein